MDVLSTIFLLFGLASYFSLFLFSPSLSRYVYLLRVPSSVQQSLAALQQVTRVLVGVISMVSFLSYLISEFLLLYFIRAKRVSNCYVQEKKN